MNITSSRVSAPVSRFVWDADLKVRDGYKIVGDVLGRLGRVCSVTTDSSSGVLCFTIPKSSLSFSASKGSSGVSQTKTLDIDLSSLDSSLRSPLESSDGSVVYYYDGSPLEFGFPCKMTVSFKDLEGYGRKIPCNCTCKLYDFNGLLIDTLSYSGSVTTQNTYGSTNSKTGLSFELPYVPGLSRVSFSVSTSVSNSTDGQYIVSASFEVGSLSLYYSGV